MVREGRGERDDARTRANVIFGVVRDGDAVVRGRERIPVEELAPRGEGGRGERGEFVGARARGVRDAVGDVRGVAGVLRGD